MYSSSHHPDCVLAAAGIHSQRHTVNYWSLYDNKILRKFRGHADVVTNVALCPASDTFLTASRDRTVRLWNVGQAGCVAQLSAPSSGSPLVAYDSTGLVFCIAAKDDQQQQYFLHLYDARNYGGGAFAELKVTRANLMAAIEQQPGISPYGADSLWKSVQFNKAGDRLLVAAERGMAFVLDGFEGTVLQVIETKSDADAVCCFATDDSTVLLGNDDGSISCWSVKTWTMEKKLAGHLGPVKYIASNPKYTQFASSCSQTALWTWDC